MQIKRVIAWIMTRIVTHWKAVGTVGTVAMVGMVGGLLKWCFDIRKSWREGTETKERLERARQQARIREMALWLHEEMLQGATANQLYCRNQVLPKLIAKYGETAGTLLTDIMAHMRQAQLIKGTSAKDEEGGKCWWFIA